ncbi:transporter substrate-binding domain-containing protein [Actinoplanes sp. NPDC049316]|uniref:transporter substrate-binding domain-containing protein n=1 Tax=Actinoplanes sp. NPDC049316 TaxID=3154727 RepID=UPI00342F7D34
MPADRRTGLTRRSLLSAAALTATTLATGCSGPGSSAQSDRLARLRRAGVARLAVAGEEPFGFVDGNGDLTGAMPQIARVVLDAIGIPRVEPLVMNFDSLIDTVRSGTADIVAAGMSITAQRCRQAAFARPDFVLRQALAVRSGNPLQLSDYRSVAARPEARLGVLAGAVEARYAAAAGVPAERIVAFRRADDLTTALITGDITAFGLTSLSARRLVGTAAPGALEATPAFAPVVDGEPRLERGAMAFDPGDRSLIEAYTSAAERLRASGDVARILRAWGFQDDEIAAGTEPGC